MLAVSHLIPPPFTQEVVRAFLEAGEDVRFLTTLTPDGNDLLARLLRAVQAGRTRSLRDIPRSAVGTYPWREATRLLAGRVLRDDLLNDRVFHCSMIADA